MKEIVVISGKGGTGKTSVTAAFAQLAAGRAIIADCDVDAADMHLLLEPEISRGEDFFSGYLAVIDRDKCIRCGECASVCRFSAVETENDEYRVVPLDCEGCGYCARICPAGAIEMELQNVGRWFDSPIKSGSRMIHARLGIGAENSGKLVARVKKEARQLAGKDSRDYVIVDGSPGVGCPVVSSLSGADYVILVTEPSVAGIHDLKRVYELVQMHRIKTGCIINKYDLNDDKTGEIKKFLEEEGIALISLIPYNENFTRAMTMGKTIVEYHDRELKGIVEDSWKKVREIVDNIN
ncbi:MAG: ATP-binding protein [Candidatus Krumholzibacteriales bacterium]